ncbi:hypothetical protein [Rhizorhabdus histidinilytica]|uniref:hypothetical protein n=1 Tax=Rhizorhabdus histidinilytica TaxID=439228 RepID=UPI0011176AD9|nr:hypothetical protein [Rhizorhabdus histidinilytica]
MSAQRTPLRERLLARVGGSVEAFAVNWNWRSHSPRVRAEQSLADAEREINDVLAELSADGATPEQADSWIERYLDKWAAYEAAGARTANPMITGPANFPVERNRKLLATEMRRYDELSQHVKGAGAWLRRQNRIAQAKLAASDGNSGAFKSVEVDGVRVVENTEMDRIQIFFPGKPAPDEIALLKGRAFKWAPSIGAWQRQLTDNARRATQQVLAAIAKATGA